jgi:hypothetical protein
MAPTLATLRSSLVSEEAFDGLRRIGRQQTRKVFQEQLDVTENCHPVDQAHPVD